MSWSVQDATELERRGIPTVTVCSAPFLKLGQAQAKHARMPSIPFVKILHPMATAASDTVAEQVKEVFGKLAERLKPTVRSHQWKNHRSKQGQVELKSKVAWKRSTNSSRTGMDRWLADHSPD
jgi:hypothetical protein